MGQKNLKILELFFEHPEKNFTVREISKKTGIPKTTVHKELKSMKEQNLITKENEASESRYFKIKKINYFTEKIISSGLIEKLIKEMNPSCIILYGSIRKGDSVKDSDIDIFVESSIKNIPDLSYYEEKLGHKIQIFVKSDINELNKNLLNNVINGIKLYGSFKVK